MRIQLGAQWNFGNRPPARSQRCRDAFKARAAVEAAEARRACAHETAGWGQKRSITRPAECNRYRKGKGRGVTRRRRGAERRHYCGKPVGGSASREAGGIPRRSPVGAEATSACLLTYPPFFLPACLPGGGGGERGGTGCTCQTVTGRVGAENRPVASLVAHWSVWLEREKEAR